MNGLGFGVSALEANVFGHGSTKVAQSILRQAGGVNLSCSSRAWFGNCKDEDCWARFCGLSSRSDEVHGFSGWPSSLSTALFTVTVDSWFAPSFLNAATSCTSPQGSGISGWQNVRATCGKALLAASWWEGCSTLTHSSSRHQTPFIATSLNSALQFRLWW